MPTPSSTRNLTRDDWLDAAMTAMAHGGVRGIRVEPLAKTMRTSKGSFYWHFRDRADLVEATLQRWEQLETNRVIEVVASTSHPRDRLRRLLAIAHRQDPERPDPSVALTGDRDDPVRVVLERVTARRIGFVADQLVALGITPGEAARRATLAYTSYLGYAALVRSAPGALPAGQDVRRYIETVLTVLASAATDGPGNG
ncbi:TetR/AcrR family transcriptional regulator [Ornithinimicrobium ciconiae]|uniref:TetR/AcrR family transcriptional regulator n=1 Tax=Ornithinimicrobium ciconiae TaxID=2594265 RepID=A0A516GEP7_9MICO|nr:TetR/AcrR family transcriptional regulator [Ornithinimicrobium ciconiae]QDO89985.1 TetR/AcrR family transcriptional regulator [Ornithinimicrobium ciconiae]